MPNTNSAKKRLRQNVVHRDRNRSVKSAIRNQLRKVREAITSGDVQGGEDQLRLATQKLDRAAARRIIHPNRAARIKSRLQRSIKSAKQQA
ncbi:MAG: 30S ribosomal protein S20 [Planctomycetaceae bacterium]|nr:30S ribosomal protein S20 [Planctomycetaceae bacterium]MBP63351.1 30S ribosomal protein S20 [Planctomycetaceae bacterium]